MHAFFVKGGPLMWPLLACSVVSLAVTLERLVFWWRLRWRRSTGTVEAVVVRTERGDCEGALAAGEGTRDLAAGVLLAGLAHRDFGLSEAMQIAAGDEIARMRRGLVLLDTIITMAPLLGILGTVLGIIESFDLLGTSGIEDPKAVTGGIAQALITTAAGLSVALVTLVPFNYFVAKVQQATKALEALATRFEVAYRRGQGNGHEAQ